MVGSDEYIMVAYGYALSRSCLSKYSQIRVSDVERLSQMDVSADIESDEFTFSMEYKNNGQWEKLSEKKGSYL